MTHGGNPSGFFGSPHAYWKMDAALCRAFAKLREAAHTERDCHFVSGNTWQYLVPIFLGIAERVFPSVPWNQFSPRPLSQQGDSVLEDKMHAALRKMAIVAAAVVTIAGTTTALPSAAQAQRWHGGGWHGGGWHGGGWRGGRGWGWGGFGLGFGTGLALAGPGWGWGWGPGWYGGGPYAFAGNCVMRRRWVINQWGHHVWRWVRVCY